MNSMKTSHPWLGKQVIIRTYSAGVHYGELDFVEGSTVRLKNSRRIWYWDGAFTLSELAEVGTLKPKNCKFSMPTSGIELDRIEIILISESALISLNEVIDYVG